MMKSCNFPWCTQPLGPLLSLLVVRIFFHFVSSSSGTRHILFAQSSKAKRFGFSRNGNCFPCGMGLVFWLFHPAVGVTLKQRTSDHRPASKQASFTAYSLVAIALKASILRASMPPFPGNCRQTRGSYCPHMLLFTNGFANFIHSLSVLFPRDITNLSHS